MCGPLVYCQLDPVEGARAQVYLARCGSATELSQRLAERAGRIPRHTYPARLGLDGPPGAGFEPHHQVIHRLRRLRLHEGYRPGRQPRHIANQHMDAELDPQTQLEGCAGPVSHTT